MLKTKALIIIVTLVFSNQIFSRDYIIFNITQQIPMGHKNEKIEKNFFINIGKIQGIKSGTVLDVHRKVSRLNPLKTWKRHQFNVKVGQLEVIHTEEYSSICKRRNTNSNETSLDLESLLLGDIVSVNINKN